MKRTKLSLRTQTQPKTSALTQLLPHDVLADVTGGASEFTQRLGHFHTSEAERLNCTSCHG